MTTNFVAMASIMIDAPKAKVWKALVRPEAIKHYMFGTDVVTDWREGSPIVWRGEWKGTSYEDKGVIVRFDPERKLRYSHFSPLTGEPDKPENYHNVTVELSEQDGRTRVALEQDNNRTEDARVHSEKNWGMMLAGLKKFVEQSFVSFDRKAVGGAITRVDGREAVETRLPDLSRGKEEGSFP